MRITPAIETTAHHQLHAHRRVGRGTTSSCLDRGEPFSKENKAEERARERTQTEYGDAF